MGKAFILLRVMGRNIGSAIRSSAWRLQLGGKGLPCQFRVASGVRLSVTDGAKVLFGEGCVFDRNATIVAKHGQLSIGARGYVGTGAVIVARKQIDIGTGVLIAEYVTIRDQDHEFETAGETRDAGMRTSPIKIGNNVWIGAKATVTKGVTIGDNVVIGANSVVTHDIPANSVAVGAPARVIRTIGAPP